MSLEQFFEGLEKHVDHLARKGAFDGKKIILFGASVTDGRCKRWLEDRGFTVDAVIDNSAEKVGREYLGLTVQTPEDVLLPFDEDRVVVITSPTYWSEMTYQVAEMGYSERRQIFTIGAGAKRANLLVFALRLLHAARGARAFRRLARGPDGPRTVFMTPVPPAGDVYVECLFVREYVRRHGLERFVIAVPNGACRRIAELFGFDDVVVLEENVLWRIVDYARFARLGADRLVVMHYPSLNGSVAQLQGFKGLNFERMFRYAAFGFGDEVAHDVPSPPVDSEAVRAELESRGLRPGRTVILSPYARSLVHGHDERFWSRLAAGLQERGYDVCTTGFGPDEPALPGTELLQFPFSRSVAFVEAAGHFVALRSGLCDAISPAAAVKVILHERGPWFKTSMFHMFSLDEMGLCDDAVEFEFASADMAAVYDDVMQALP